MSFPRSPVVRVHDTLPGVRLPSSGGHVRQLRMESTYDGGGIGKGGDVTLYVDGASVGHGRVERTHWVISSMDETTEVGSVAGAPVSDDHGPAGTDFTATVNWCSSTSTPPPPTSTTSSRPSPRPERADLGDATSRFRDVAPPRSDTGHWPSIVTPSRAR